MALEFQFGKVSQFETGSSTRGCIRYFTKPLLPIQCIPLRNALPGIQTVGGFSQTVFFVVGCCFVAKLKGSGHIVKTASRIDIRRIAKANLLELGILRNGSGGLGAILRSQATPGCIEGVRVAPLQIHPDDRGFFEEVCRLGQDLAQSFAAAKNVQFSAALSYPGTVKAIHYHLRQTDLWTPVLGQFQVMLYDLRIDSATFGQTNTCYTGVLRPLQILIPPGVGHGYKVLGTESALLVYATDQFYDPSDEGRLPWNDADICYDWETQRK